MKELLAWIWLSHLGLGSIFLLSSPNCSCGVSEDHCAQDECSYNTILACSLHEQKPVEVVSFPEILKVNTLFDNTLFFGSIKASPVDDKQLSVEC